MARARRESSAAPPGAEPPVRSPEPIRTPPRTVAGSTWVMACIAVLLLILLIVFIAQNTGSVKLSFFSLHGRFPLVVELLAAVAVGCVLTLALGTTRILQLRRIVRRYHREDLAAAAAAAAAAEAATTTAADEAAEPDTSAVAEAPATVAPLQTPETVPVTPDPVDPGDPGTRTPPPA